MASFAGALRYIAHPRFTGIIFRNTYDEIIKLSEQEARPLYEPLGGVFRENKFWKFPSGARIYLSYLERDQDAFKHQGPAYQYICFDELTHFSRFCYRYLFSRARSKEGLPKQVRATCNPEPGWVKERWAPWLDEEYPGPRAKSGQILWYITDKDGKERYVPRGTPDAISRCFIKSLLDDNPSLANDLSYRNFLKSLDPVQRARLLEGNWSADYTPGLLFRRSMFPIIMEAEVPKRAFRVRSWDLAATEEKLKGSHAFRPTAENQPDWTAGVLYGWAPETGFFIEHIERLRGRPEAARAAVARIAQQDVAQYGAAGVIFTIPQDPGQAGKDQAAAYVDMLKGLQVKVRVPSGSKVVRAGPASSTAENMGIKLVKAPWNQDFLLEAEQFPKGHFDDQIDALSDAHATLGEWREIVRKGRERQRNETMPDFSP